jgi:MinD-like ATPase involved in chromosome partitioning or flagellar assembly
MKANISDGARESMARRLQGLSESARQRAAKTNPFSGVSAQSAEFARIAKQLDQMRTLSYRREAERAATPIVTSNPTSRLSEQVQALTEVVITLTTINERSERSSRRLYWLRAA